MGKRVPSESGKAFWDTVIETLGGSHNLLELQKEVVAICECSSNAVAESYRKKSMPSFRMGIAIAVVLRISPFQLGLFDYTDMHINKIPTLTRIQKVKFLDRLFSTISKAFNVSIQYKFADDKEDTSLLSKFSAISNAQTEGFDSLLLTCSGNVSLQDIYPQPNEVSIYCESHYIVHCGNIYPTESRHISETVSFYEYIERSFNDDSCSSLRDEISKWYGTYRMKRYAMGVLGELNADNFYKLQYLLGYLLKQ